MSHHTYSAEFIDKQKPQAGFKARTTHHAVLIKSNIKVPKPICLLPCVRNCKTASINISLVTKSVLPNEIRAGSKQCRMDCCSLKNI